ncbi:MAG: hypothetical protein ACRD21_07155, partial [Vicinamibacteria bacterium]
MFFVCAASLSLVLQTEAAKEVSYSLTYREALPAIVSVRMDLPSGSAGPRTLVIPRAIPMGYGEQHFDRFVTAVRAYSSDAQPLEVAREDGPRFRVGGAGAAVARVEYEVDVSRMEREILSASDTSKARTGYLSLLGYSVFGYIEGLEELPILLVLELPASWPILTTLGPRMPLEKGRVSGAASNFYALADSQIVAGPKLEVRALEVGTPSFFALYSEGEVDRDLLAELAGRAMNRVIEYFGAAPFPHYTALQELLAPVSENHRYGFSMEHLDSATFYLSQETGLTSGSPSSERDRVLYNFAHHFAHAWVPKRSYGKGYYP